MLTNTGNPTYLYSIHHYYYSGKHHKAVQGINLITLYYTDRQGNSQPINYRLYDPKDNLTKNDYFQTMLDEVLHGGLNLATLQAITGTEVKKTLNTSNLHNAFKIISTV